MKKAHLRRFGKQFFLFNIATILCTQRVEESEKHKLLKDKFIFEELILEIETNQPIGFLRKKNFFFDLNEHSLEEAQNAFRNNEIAGWYIRINSASEKLNTKTA